EDGGRGGQAPSTAHPEVLGVHVQLLTVQLGQLGIGCLEVFQVLDGFPEGGEHFLAMGADLGVANDGGGTGEVPKVIEEPLGPGVDDQQPGERWRGDTSRHRDVNAPQCNCHSFSVQGAAEQMPGSWTYLARASAPHSSTLILLQMLVMSCFSSADQCTMVAGGFAQSCRRTQTP
uniref:Uncharacterized protein n=1 Tax=Aquila chrysaetos chrysaetos TaxID=223781 RepID=A0A663ET09_AQUCH